MSYTESPPFSIRVSDGKVRGQRDADNFREYFGSKKPIGSRHWIFELNEANQAEAHDTFIAVLGLPDLKLDIEEDQIIEDVVMPNNNGLVLVRQEVRLHKGNELGHTVCFFAQPETLAS